MKYLSGLIPASLALLVCAAGLAQQVPPRPPANITGSVKKVDAAGRRITVAGLGSGRAERIVSIPAGVVVTRIRPARQTDLKVGDAISISGLPLVFNATQVRIGDEPLRGDRDHPRPPGNRAPRPPGSGREPAPRRPLGARAITARWFA